jgi:hypothetical protein
MPKHKPSIITSSTAFVKAYLTDKASVKFDVCEVFVFIKSIIFKMSRIDKAFLYIEK